MQPGSLNKNNPEALKAVEALNSVKRREESKVSSIIAGRRVLNSPPMHFRARRHQRATAADRDQGISRGKLGSEILQAKVHLADYFLL